MLMLTSKAQAGNRRSERRGIVLILILAMLSIMALLGVTFATLSGQAQVGARYYASGRNFTTPETYFDFAMNQLVNDTSNPKSAMRGHSLLRDAYGNDATNNGFLGSLPNGMPVLITAVQAGGQPGTILLGTNIPYGNPNFPTLFAKNFNRWIVRLPNMPAVPNTSPATASQTMEVAASTNNNGFYVLTVSAPSGDPALTQPIQGMNIVLDGRFLHAFSGPGVAASMVPSPLSPTGTANPAMPNFLFNGLSPRMLGMDEDYDAPDLENWFMGVQSADGKSITLPSFHRPGIVSLTDWKMKLNPNLSIDDPANVQALRAKSKFLRPRGDDHPAGQTTFPDLVPDPTTGSITYDVDNDGDGTTDSVWIDLGFPVQRAPNGKLFKPLFSFMVLGLNGRLPLNTAGNLAARSYIDDPNTDVSELGTPLFDHASHQGVSPSEVNPKFAFRSPSIIAQQASYDLEMHRKLLTGDFASRTGAGVGVGPTPGRYGEEGLLDPNPGNNVPYLSNTLRQPPNLQAGDVATTTLAFPGYAVRPGWTTPVLQPYGSTPIAVGPYYDDNFNSTDFAPIANNANPENADVMDAVGGLQFAAERLRYGVLPTDPFGVGRRMAFNELPDNTHPFGPLFDYGRGADSKGRLGFFLHYRPPGFIPGINQLSDLVTNPYASPNIFHGFDSYRDPIGPTFAAQTAAPYPPVWNRILFGGMPYNENSGQTVPTFYPFPVGQNLGIGYPGIVDANSGLILPAVPAAAPTAPSTLSMLPGGSLAWGEADQLNLYKPTSHDTPFSALDLEWLYRFNDPDFTSLSSRLANLGPAYNSANGLKRYFDPTPPAHNRLFSVDSWDPTTFTYPTDNPGNAFPNNSRWKSSDSPTLSLPPAIQTPQLLQRDRKINLNFPFSPQNSIYEPVRLAWINTTYQLLKRILPPKAVDHPEELARLGQYVVNIVDFRDADPVMTIWTNPDVKLTAADATHSPKAVFANDATAATGDAGKLIHVGMEYQPIAITEVLAYSFKRKAGNSSTPTPRFFIEFANLLTRNGATPNAANNNSPQDTLSDMDFKGWDIVVTREDSQGTGFARPNPLTGQLAFTWSTPGSNTPNGTVYAKIAKLSPSATTGTANKLKGIDAGGTVDHDVFGLPSPAAGQSIEVTQGGQPFPPTNAAVTNLQKFDYTGDIGQTDLLPSTPATEAGSKGAFHWVYLRRPANPALIVQEDPTKPNFNPLVVVDSARFPYVESGGDGQMVNNQPQVTQGKQGIWSVQRLQPYRGGQAVPNDATTKPSAEFSPATAYGYTEQMDNASGGNPANRPYGLYDPATGYNTSNLITQPIYSTLGDATRNSETWDPLVFLDRDFESVAELLLVPTVAPGLFTKQFVENTTPQDPSTASALVYPNGPWLPGPGATTKNNDPLKFPYRAPSTALTAPGQYEEGKRLVDADGPHAYPFLADSFFYTADGQSTTDGTGVVPTPNPNAVVDGPTGAGWHKILGFFEVPSSAMGAIGPVAQGVNRDWYREDVRPGLLNPNLFVDEEVFFGWIDDPRMNYAQTSATVVGPSQVATQATPVVTSLDARGGFAYIDPMASVINPPTPPHANPKGAWLDFLAARNAYVTNGTSVAPLLFGSATAEQPFHDISYPDINYTLFRPAGRRNATNQINDSNNNPLGVKLTYPVDVTGKLQTVLLPPQIPPRRLLEIPSLEMAETVRIPNMRVAQTEINLFDQTPVSNISVLSDLFANLGAPPAQQGGAITPTYDATKVYRYMLGANRYGVAPPNAQNYSGQSDLRQHPAYRIELLSKLMNLTTVRTHQYSVWVTVGLFEVVQEGNAEKAAQLGNPDLAFDRLGPELGKDQGTATRYRMFYVIDRSKAAGFNPQNPDDFRNIITYQKRIE